MTFPDDRTMLSLASLGHASGGKYTPDGRTFARVQITDDTHRLWEVLDAEMYELERQGWIEMIEAKPDDPPDQAGVRVTTKGEYALTRWLQKNRRRVRELIDTHYPREAT